MGENKLLFDLISYKILKKDISDIDECDFSDASLSAILTRAKSHDIAQIISSSLEELGKLPAGELSEEYRRQQFIAIYRYENLNYEKKEICRILEEARIPYILLKGTYLRDFYPEPYLRTSADIDVFVANENVQSAEKLFTDELKYIKKSQWTNELSFYSESGMHIELHYLGAVENDNEMFVLEDVWDNVFLREGYEYRYDMSTEFFYVSHIAHMAKHFLHGGCGIKPFVDMCVIREKLTCDKNKTDVLLKKYGLKQFADNAEKLTSVWFCGDEHNSISEQMEEYIISGGVFGNKTNRVSVGQVKQKGKLNFILSRIFMPYDKLKHYYPVIEKHKWLTPICEVRRWFRLIFFKGRLSRSVKELKINGKITQEESAELASLLENLGL